MATLTVVPTLAESQAAAAANAAKPGSASTEFGLSKIVVMLGSAVAGLGMLMAVLANVAAILPPSAGMIGVWLAIGGTSLATLKSIVYEIQRGFVKVAALKAGQTPPLDVIDAAAAAAIGAVSAANAATSLAA